MYEGDSHSYSHFHSYKVWSLLIDLQAYDSHCNLVLGEVEETIYVVEEDEDEEETVRV